MLGRKLTAMVSGIASVLVLAGTAPATAEPNRVLSDFLLGVQFLPENFDDQCGGPQEQWSNGWTEPIRLNTDNRGGGCKLSLSVEDTFGELGGIQLSYTWLPHAGADATQCGTIVGRRPIPILPFPIFPQPIRIDTDGRHGWCELTFAMASPIGRTDVGLEIKFYADGHQDQCKHSTLPGESRLVTVGAPATFGVDTDNRPGGCLLSMRLVYR